MHASRGHIFSLSHQATNHSVIRSLKRSGQVSESWRSMHASAGNKPATPRSTFQNRHLTPKEPLKRCRLRYSDRIPFAPSAISSHSDTIGGLTWMRSWICLISKDLSMSDKAPPIRPKEFAYKV